MKQLTLLLTLILIGIILTINTFAKTIVTDGLVSYWSFDQHTINDGIVEDIWGENDARIIGNPQVAQGHIKEGLELDGDGDYVRLPNFGNFGMKTDTYTFELRFKTSYKENWSAIYKVQEPPCTGDFHGYGILINAWKGWALFKWDGEFETKEDFMMILRTDKAIRNTCVSSNTTIIRPVTDGEWHHLVYTTRRPTKEELKEAKINGNNAFCRRNFLYIDSNLIWDSLYCVNPDSIRHYRESTFLGAVNDAGFASGYFKGVFDEVRVYDTWLTHTQVRQNYRSLIGYNVKPDSKLPTIWGAIKKNR